MRNVILYIIFLILFVPKLCFCQGEKGSVKTSFVLQQWDIEKIDDKINEVTFPIEVNYLVQDNLNIQINHFPAMSTFGSNNMSGLSDTWIRTAYSFANDKAMASIGIGIPTGKTELDSEEIVLSRLLSEQAFKFQLPVFGQGMTVSGGIMYAHPFNDDFTIGAGLNYVFRNSYKFSTSNQVEYNPGEQFGINIGFDYQIIENLRSNVDIVLNYYSTDKIDNKEIFTFEFNFRADYEGDPAFLVENEGEVFVLVGKKIEFEFIGLEESGVLDEEETTEDEEDEFDFSMM